MLCTTLTAAMDEPGRIGLLDASSRSAHRGRPLAVCASLHVVRWTVVARCALCADPPVLGSAADADPPPPILGARCGRSHPSCLSSSQRCPRANPKPRQPPQVQAVRRGAQSMQRCDRRCHPWQTTRSHSRHHPHPHPQQRRNNSSSRTPSRICRSRVACSRVQQGVRPA